jgi:predicted short-subunit dehydrogenase-like oxidoreductase (DUF2520 family)
VTAPESLPDLTLVGPGRAGAILARCWKAAGGRVLRVLARRAETAAELARELGAAAASTADPGAERADLLVLAVPDDAIAAVASELAPRISADVVLHLSGARGSAELAPFAERGAGTASVHPLRPFTGDRRENWEGAVVAVEGEEKTARLADEIARRLGARPHRLSAAAKPLYHLGATLAAGATMALLSEASALWEEAGFAEADSRPALAGLAEHAARAFGSARAAAEAFTGPVARRDLDTIRAHWKALSGRPGLAAVYAELAREILAKTPGRGNEAAVLAIVAPRRDG